MTDVAGRTRTTGILATLSAVLIWAGWIPVTRWGVIGHLNPIDVTALRYGTSGLILLPFFWCHRHAVPWHRPGWLALIAVGAGAPNFFLFGMGLRLANSGQAAVFGPGASSVFTLLLARIWLGESITLARAMGILCTVTGFAWVAGHDVLTGGARIGGFGLILLASFAWSTFTIASRRLALPPLLTVAIVGVINAVWVWPLYVISGGPTRLAQAPLSAVLLQAGYQGILTGTLAMMAFTFAIGRLGAAGAAAFTPLTPVLASVIGWWILGDGLDLATAVGLVAVAIGVVVGGGSIPRFKAT